MTNTKQLPKSINIFLLIMPLFAFLTGVSFISGIANNIGPFEFAFLGLFVFTFLNFWTGRATVHGHPVALVVFLIFLIATLVLPRITWQLEYGIIQLALLFYMLLFVMVFHNLFVMYPHVVRALFRYLAYAVLIISVWIFAEIIRSGGEIGVVGPFRGRAHMGYYMVSAFWGLLLYIAWPGVSNWERLLFALTIPLVLYDIGMSGRRSAYLSLIAGLLGLACSFVVLTGKERFRITGPFMVAAAILGFTLLAFGASGIQIPGQEFIFERINGIDDRLALVTVTEEDTEDEQFLRLQREGMLAALRDYPFLGIGWGGFYDSPYSPTGHEMHSTPQRFLAELGLIGFSLYLVFLGYFLVNSLKLFFKMRKTPYQLVTFIFAVAWWSLAISYAYNRHTTERTFWLLMILFIGLEYYLQQQYSSEKQVSRPQTTFGRSARRPVAANARSVNLVEAD